MTAQAPASKPIQVGLISLGCAKNLVDAEIMLGALLKGGMRVINDPAEADVVIVNTCSFIDAAQEESVDAILESDELRSVRKPEQGLVVSGCLPQRFREELPQLLPEVDAFMGIDQVAEVGEIVRRAWARRRDRMAAPAAPRPRGQRGRKADTAAGLQSAAAKDTEARAEEHGTPHRTGGGGKTRTVVTPGAAPPGPLLEVSRRPTFIPDFGTPRFRLTPRHFAYLKIAEGCNHPCSFCIIPRMRGSHRSRAQSDIVEEARRLLDEGVREINLISQDSTYYGLDLRPNRAGSIAAPERFAAASRELPGDAVTLSSLLRELNALPGEFWIRLLYTHPAHWTDGLIGTIAECEKVARYVDMPLQHIHENMLERMRRETSRAYIEGLIERIRAGIPGIAIRTTFIVGFPGETASCFDALTEFIERTRFERLGVFAYSKEEGTRAASMAGHVPDAVKQDRRARAMAAQQVVSRSIAAAQVGRTIKVLVETAPGPIDPAVVSSWEHGLIRAEGEDASMRHGAFAVARGEADAPDIDGRVYVRGGGEPGAFTQVEIVDHTDYDLIAKPVGKRAKPRAGPAVR